jgi:Ser/Thr protein kinase RdoA (MazF antagonist)
MVLSIGMKNYQFWVDHFSSASPDIQKTFVELTPSSCKDILKKYNIPVREGVTFESAENRVFGFGNIVIKFYRPGRWSLEALKQEVLFLSDLKTANVPVVCPIGDVGTWKGVHYIVFETIQSSYKNEVEVLNEESVKQLSHLLARTHQVGAKRDAPDRPQFDPSSMTKGCFEVVLKAGYLPRNLEKRYEETLNELVIKLSVFNDIPSQRIHGDAYSGNVIWGADGPILIDFDDFQVGPTAIDVKLLSFPWRLDTLPESMDRKERRMIQQELVLSFYREIQPFPKSWEAIFPLMSAYRDIQFDAWFSSRWDEPGFAKHYEEEDITKLDWWKENIEGLERLLAMD